METRTMLQQTESFDNKPADGLIEARTVQNGLLVGRRNIMIAKGRSFSERPFDETPAVRRRVVSPSIPNYSNNGATNQESCPFDEAGIKLERNNAMARSALESDSKSEASWNGDLPFDEPLHLVEDESNETVSLTSFQRGRDTSPFKSLGRAGYTEIAHSVLESKSVVPENEKGKKRSQLRAHYESRRDKATSTSSSSPTRISCPEKSTDAHLNDVRRKQAKSKSSRRTRKSLGNKPSDDQRKPSRSSRQQRARGRHPTHHVGGGGKHQSRGGEVASSSYLSRDERVALSSSQFSKTGAPASPDLVSLSSSNDAAGHLSLSEPGSPRLISSDESSATSSSPGSPDDSGVQSMCNCNTGFPWPETTSLPSAVTDFNSFLDWLIKDPDTSPQAPPLKQQHQHDNIISSKPSTSASTSTSKASPVDQYVQYMHCRMCTKTSLDEGDEDSYASSNCENSQNQETLDDPTLVSLSTTSHRGVDLWQDRLSSAGASIQNFIHRLVENMGTSEEERREGDERNTSNTRSDQSIVTLERTLSHSSDGGEVDSWVRGLDFVNVDVFDENNARNTYYKYNL